VLTRPSSDSYYNLSYNASDGDFTCLLFDKSVKEYIYHLLRMGYYDYDGDGISNAEDEYPYCSETDPNSDCV